jgi:tRNA(fMet)-specific endonuclease VapC
MSDLLLDTNVVSIRFNRNHRLRPACMETVAGHQLAISFMTLAELLLWPEGNNWGNARRQALERYTAL